MESKQITFNDIKITVHSDGSISKPNNKFKDKRTQRTFGTKSANGYMLVRVGKTLQPIHRITASAFLDDFSDFPEVDHIDGDKTNNGVSNLRMTTGSSNCRAHRNKMDGCSSHYRGVSWSKARQKWHAYCRVDGHLKSLGHFNEERDAAISRDTYALSQGFPLEGLNLPENYS